jgi:hypothetical protein
MVAACWVAGLAEGGREEACMAEEAETVVDTVVEGEEAGSAAPKAEVVVVRVETVAVAVTKAVVAKAVVARAHSRS